MQLRYIGLGGSELGPFTMCTHFVSSECFMVIEFGIYRIGKGNCIHEESGVPAYVASGFTIPRFLKFMGE